VRWPGEDISRPRCLRARGSVGPGFPVCGLEHRRGLRPGHGARLPSLPPPRARLGSRNACPASARRPHQPRPAARAPLAPEPDGVRTQADQSVVRASATRQIVRRIAIVEKRRGMNGVEQQRSERRRARRGRLTSSSRTRSTLVFHASLRRSRSTSFRCAFRSCSAPCGTGTRCCSRSATPAAT
jgi:hypothetical protein